MLANVDAKTVNAWGCLSQGGEAATTEGSC